MFHLEVCLIAICRYQTSWTTSKSSSFFLGGKLQGFLSAEHYVVITGGMEVKCLVF